MVTASEGKTAKNRTHLDINVGDRQPASHIEVDAEVKRLADPEGNEFCVQ